MNTCKFFYLLAARILLSLIFIISSNTLAFPKTISIQELNTLVTRVEQDAEKQITGIHGQQAMISIKNTLQKEYHLNTLPVQETGGPCPAIGYGKEDIGSTIEVKALNQSGVYYIFGVTAMLKNYLFIAKWGFAKASLMAMECPANLSNLGFTLNACKAYDDAITILTYAKKLDPADSSIYVNLSFSYKKLHKYNEAINEMMIAVSLQPELKKYKEMLDERKKLKRKAKKYQMIGNPKKNIGSGLENALDLLENRKIEESNKEIFFEFNPSFPSNNVSSQNSRNWRHKVRGMIPSYDTSIFGEDGNAACGYFKKQAHLLVRMGDGMVEKAGMPPLGGNPIAKFILTGHAHDQKSKHVVAKIDAKSYNSRLEVIKDVASIGALETAEIFYGIAGKMYEMCGEMEPDPDMDRFLDNLIKERENRNKIFFKNLDKEKFSKPVCSRYSPKICISKGNQGSTKISISESSITGDFQIHPTNIYKYQFKMSTGGDILKKSIGNFAGGVLSCNNYFEYKFGRGMSTGTEISIGANIDKYFTATAGKTIFVTHYNFEN